MAEFEILLLSIGGILLLGLATEFLGRRSFLPRVTLLLLLGILMGDQVTGVIPAALSDRFEVIAEISLMIVGFLLGGRLEFSSLRQFGWVIIAISVFAALSVAGLVTGAMLLLGLPVEIAILLGCIASATAPAATVDTVLESGVGNRFTTVLLAVVAVDDAWALILFSLGLSLAAVASGVDGPSVAVLGALREIGGGLLVGGAIGVPAAYLTGRIRPGKPMLMEALGLVFFCGGAASMLDVSMLIAMMTMGAAVSNLSRHHEYPFHEIENVELPFLAVFFVLAGASLAVDELEHIGFIGIAYIAARVVGKVAGAWLGGWLGKAPGPMRRWMGLAMLPQAGVPIGMALITANRFPEAGTVVLTVIVATTVVFDIVGPLLTKLAMNRADAD